MLSAFMLAIRDCRRNLSKYSGLDTNFTEVEVCRLAEAYLRLRSGWLAIRMMGIDANEGGVVGVLHQVRCDRLQRTRFLSHKHAVREPSPNHKCRLGAFRSSHRLCNRKNAAGVRRSLVTTRLQPTTTGSLSTGAQELPADRSVRVSRAKVVAEAGHARMI